MTSATSGHLAAWLRGFGWIPYAVIGFLLIAELAAILLMNGGRLTYSLDDPYIHLALAENIARGHYGINLAEVSAPSSSILWPVLLVPFSGTAFHDDWPLLINCMAALGSIGVLQAIIRRVLPADAAPFRWMPPLIVLLAALVFNLVGLVFTGMEHSLQVLLALLLVLGLLVEAEERRIPWYLIAAILAGPLVRYENLGLSLGALLYLALRGRLALAVALGFASLLPLAGFSLFLRAIGLEWLPSSVLLKSGLPPADATLASTVRALADSILTGPGQYARMVLLGMTALAVVRALRPGGEAAARPLAIGVLAMAAAHLAVGKYGWFGRYEVYLLVSLTMLTLHLYRRELSVWLRRSSPLPAAMLMVLAACFIGAPTVWPTFVTPLAANNIFQQQYQMHRFVAWRAGGEPVAVNDLGWVSYRNDGHVLDLWGLGSAEAGARRLAREPGWMHEMTERHGVRLAMLYDDWFGDQIPEHWDLLGELRLGRARVTAARGAVAFYATDPAAAGELSRELAAFAETLPEGVTFHDAPGAGIASDGEARPGG